MRQLFESPYWNTFQSINGLICLYNQHDDTQAPRRKRDSQEDMIEKVVEKKNTPAAVDDPYVVALMVENGPCIIEKGKLELFI